MLEALGAGLLHVLAWPAIGFLFLGVLVGVWLGAVPGLGGLIGLIIILPFTYKMAPVSAFALMLALFAVTSTGDTITAIMLGIPGTAASQATILDGYPMAMKGEAARALGAAFTVSAIGGVLGAAFMAVSLPFILPVILLFGSPEFFMLAVLGLALVGSLSGSSSRKGLGAAAIGLLLAQVGYAVIQPIPRFYFGTDYLLDGLPLVPTVLGIFALPELMELAVRETSIARIPKEQAMAGGLMRGVRDAIEHWWLMLRCSAIGVYIGMVPGLGVAIVDWLAYGHTVQSAKDKSRFGQGDVRGVIGPESANNAERGGSMIPTVAFGIPGGTSNAILLSALLIQGLNPGPAMLTTHLDITFSMVWTLIIANIVAAALLMVTTNQLAKVAFLPGHFLVPGVILFVFMGAWIADVNMGDWVTLIVMGFVGTVMKRSGWPRPPVVLAFVLGPIMENSFIISLRGFGLGFLWRPATLVILVLAVLTLYMSFRGVLRAKRTGNQPTEGEGRERNPFVSMIFAGIGFVVFAGAAIRSYSWPLSVALFPQVVSIPATFLFLAVFVVDVRAVVADTRASGSLSAVIRSAGRSMLIERVLLFLTWLAGIVAVTMVAGQLVALPLYIAGYLLVWGRTRWLTALAYAACGWLFLYGFYGKLLNVFWYPSLLFS